jgi:hypothetical protein
MVPAADRVMEAVRRLLLGCCVAVRRRVHARVLHPCFSQGPCLIMHIREAVLCAIIVLLLLLMKLHHHTQGKGDHSSHSPSQTTAHS